MDPQGEGRVLVPQRGGKGAEERGLHRERDVGFYSKYREATPTGGVQPK